MPRPLDIRRSLLGKMLVVTLAPAFVLLSTISLYFYLQVHASLEKEMGRRLVGLARSAVAEIEPEQVFLFMPGDETSRAYRALSDKLGRLAQANDVQRIYVVDVEQRVIFNTERDSAIGEKMYHLAGHRVELKRVRQLRAVDSALFKGIDGKLYKAGYAPLVLDGEVVGTVGVDADVRFFDQLHTLRRNLVLISLVGLLAFAVTGVAFARRLTAPLRRLALGARRIGEGDYETPVAEPTGDEIGLLAETLNDMRQRIVERDRELQMMQRGIAHEVRNPLGGMELYCGILREELTERPDLMRHVDKIQREIDGLEQVVNEFLDFTKHHVPDARRVNLPDYVAELMLFYAGMCERQGITLVKEIQPELNEATFDPDLVRRALHNLLLNAVQAMPDGGTLNFSVCRSARDLEIRIADTGKGIDAGQAKNIFTPFFTTKEKGTGLGLPFARKITDSHGGSLELQSRPGEGTGIVLRLPQPEREGSA